MESDCEAVGFCFSEYATFIYLETGERLEESVGVVADPL